MTPGGRGWECRSGFSASAGSHDLSTHVSNHLSDSNDRGCAAPARRTGMSHLHDTNGAAMSSATDCGAGAAALSWGDNYHRNVATSIIMSLFQRVRQDRREPSAGPLPAHLASAGMPKMTNCLGDAQFTVQAHSTITGGFRWRFTTWAAADPRIGLVCAYGIRRCPHQAQRQDVTLHRNRPAGFSLSNILKVSKSLALSSFDRSTPFVCMQQQTVRHASLPNLTTQPPHLSFPEGDVGPAGRCQAALACSEA